MESKKFYWLKLKKDFFKRHDIRIIQKMPNGEQIILFYLKLMLESIDHEGELRFSKELPYTSDMLSTIMDTDVGIVETSLEVLEKFGLLKIKKDKTISIDMVKSMLGFETEFARQKRLWREQKGQSQDNVKTMSKTKSRQCQDEVRQEIEKEIEIETEKEKEKEGNLEFPNPREREFESFWHLYPRKEGKLKAKMAYINSDVRLGVVLGALGQQLSSEQWQRDNGRFIPLPASWLKQRRWEDESPSKQQGRRLDDQEKAAIRRLMEDD